MGRVLDWVIPASIVVAIEYAVALSIGATVGFHYQLPTKTYLIVALTIAALILTAALLLHVGKYFRDREENPIERLLVDISNGRSRIIGILIGFFLIGLQGGALTWLKVMLPITQGFWADLPLAEADRIMFGKDPWIISHSLFGSITGLLDQVYVTWAPVKLVTVIGVTLAAATLKKSHAMLAYFLTISTCCLVQFALPSAGPVFYAHLGLGDQFLAMPIEPWVAAARDYLWADYLAGGGNPGGGISAMPSVHVAMTLWVALVVRSYFPRVQFLAWIYFAAILIGSVHLGWHYAVDGVASIAIALIAWAVAPFLLVKTGQPKCEPCIAP